VVQEILERLPTPALEIEARHARTYVTLCFLRLGYYERAAQCAQADWEFMDKEGQLHFAEFSGSMGVDGLLAQGDLDGGRKLMAKIEATLRRRVDSEHSHATIYYCAACALAQYAGDFERAESLMKESRRLLEADLTPRVRGARVAQELRTCRLRGDDMAAQQSTFAELETLFEMGRCYGAQDLLAEELWHERIRLGDRAGATDFLRNYLRDRREEGAAEFSLMHATAEDPAWESYPSDDNTNRSCDLASR
jgi:hypothetical protein